jgi:hypothetical protein
VIFSVADDDDDDDSMTLFPGDRRLRGLCGVIT